MGDDRHCRELPRARGAVPALSVQSCATGMRTSRMTRPERPAFIPAARSSFCSTAKARRSRRNRRRGLRQDSQGRPPGPAVRDLDHQRDRIWARLSRRGGAALGEFARQRGLGFHMDGARLANALATTGEDLADVTWRAGRRRLVVRFRKNGGLSAEALILFKTELADEIAVRRKRAGHLLSKGRFLAAQILAMLDGDLWLRQCARRQCRRADARAGRARAVGLSGGSERDFPEGQRR